MVDDGGGVTPDLEGEALGSFWWLSEAGDALGVTGSECRVLRFSSSPLLLRAVPFSSALRSAYASLLSPLVASRVGRLSSSLLCCFVRAVFRAGASPRSFVSLEERQGVTFLEWF